MKTVFLLCLCSILLTTSCFALGIGVTTQELFVEQRASFLITNPNEEMLSFSVFSDGDILITPTEGVIAAGSFQEVHVEKEGPLPEYVFVQGRADQITVPALGIRLRELEQKERAPVMFPWSIFLGMILLALVVSMIVLVILRRR